MPTEIMSRTADKQVNTEAIDRELKASSLLFSRGLSASFETRVFFPA